MKFDSIKNFITNPNSIVTTFGKHNLLNWLPDKQYIQLAYRNELDKKLNLKNPTLYSEKIQWIKLYDRKAIYTTYVDKYLVRNFITETIGEEYLVPLYAVYDNPREISLDSLPEQFILKCNHSSGMNMICTNKNTFDFNKTIKLFDLWLKQNWFHYGREWAYKNVKPKITCEKFLSVNSKAPDDYKILCFNGQAKIIELHKDRFKTHTLDIYDVDWNLHNEYVLSHLHSPIPDVKPIFLEEMIQLSQQLAKETFFVRVDWFYHDNKLYFGEITLYESSGFIKKDNLFADKLFGDWLKLPIKQ